MPNPSSISLQEAQDLIDRYGRNLNSQADLTQFIAFNLADLQSMLNGFASQAVGANAIKIYLGQDLYIDENRDEFNRLTVFFQPAVLDQNGQYSDVAYDPNNTDSHPHNVGVASPPPISVVGFSHYY